MGTTTSITRASLRHEYYNRASTGTNEHQSVTIACVDWQRLAKAVTDRRAELGYRTREAFVAATGLSRRLIGDIENGRRDNYDQITLSRLEDALRWKRGRVNDLLQGELEERAAAPKELPELQTAAGIARHVHRDDLPLVALLHRSGLDDTTLFRIILKVRAIRERQSAELLAEVAELIRAAGGWAPDQPYPPSWLFDDETDAR